MSRAIPLLLLLLTLSPNATVHAGDRAIEKRIAAYASPLAASGYLSGCLLVSKGDAEIAHARYGFMDGARRVLSDSKTRFCVASLTKPITAVAILRLVDENKLRTNDPITRWINDFPSGDSITVADVMTHTAGIPHRVTTPEEEVERFTPADIVARIKDKGLLFPPHTKQQYSSAGYTVLAYIIEQVTGMDYGDAMTALVFEPLGMKDTFHPDGRMIARRATSFVAGAEGPVEAPEKDYAFLAGAGSLYSTCDDMRRFAQAYLERRLLSDEAWREFHDQGWAEGDVVRWSGSTNGFASWLDIYKDDGSVYVFLGNAGTGATNILRAALPALVAGEEVAPAPHAPAPIALSMEEMQGIEGGYARTGSIPTLLVKIDSGVLHMGDSVVYPIAIDRFFNPTYFSEAAFKRGNDHIATRIEITAPGLSAPLVFNRIE